MKNVWVVPCVVAMLFSLPAKADTSGSFSCSQTSPCVSVLNSALSVETALSAGSLNGNGVVGTSASNTSGIAAGFFGANGGTNSTAVAAENTANGTGLYASSGSGYAGYFSGKVNVQGCFQVNGTNEFGCNSDARLKKDIAPVANALSTMLALRGVTFDWKDPSEGTRKQTGFIAQDVEKVIPAWVGEDARGYKTLTISPSEFSALTVESVRTLKMENDQLRARLNRFEARATGFGFTLGAMGLVIGGLVFASRRRAR
jgi:hypothetical protein